MVENAGSISKQLNAASPQLRATMSRHLNLNAGSLPVCT
jgi:hypothetical protein